jgi:hypothetical protein
MTDMKKFGLSLWFLLCGMAAVQAQEVKIEMPPENKVAMDIPNNYQIYEINAKWDEQMRANLLTAIKFQNYRRAYEHEIDPGQS